MAACGGVERPAFLELHLKKVHLHHLHRDIESDSFLNFTPSCPSSSSPSFSSSSSSMSSPDQNLPLDKNDQHASGGSTDKYNAPRKGQHGQHNSFSSMSSESLIACTEGLGFESSDDMEEDISSNGREERLTRKLQAGSELSRRSYPPPISCIGRNGKPLVYFVPYRENGRFILKEIRIPNQEMLHSYRENGRFRLRFILSDDETLEEEDAGNKNGDGQVIDNDGEEGEREGETCRHEENV